MPSPPTAILPSARPNSGRVRKPASAPCRRTLGRLVLVGGALAAGMAYRAVYRKRLLATQPESPAAATADACRRPAPSVPPLRVGRYRGDFVGHDLSPAESDGTIEPGRAHKLLSEIKRQWLRSYIATIRPFSGYWALLALLLSVAWFDDQEASWFVTLVLAILGIIVLGAFVPITPLQWWREMGRSPPMKEALTTGMVVVVVITAIYLGRAVVVGTQRLGTFLEGRGREVDADVLLATFLVALAAAASVILRVRLGLLYRRDRASDEIRCRLRAAHERMWVLSLIALALIPSALQASWVPNILTNAIIPLAVLQARAQAAIRQR